MIYLAILFIFNVIIIIILSNVKRPSFDKLSKYKLSEYKIVPPMMLHNKGVSLNEIDINKYCSIFIESDNKIEEVKKNE